MRAQSAICAAVTAITTTITVAAGVFAPGHLGELTWQVPFELADAVLEETRAAERRLRVLPSRAGIYFVLALGLFPGLGYQGAGEADRCAGGSQQRSPRQRRAGRLVRSGPTSPMKGSVTDMPTKYTGGPSDNPWGTRRRLAAMAAASLARPPSHSGYANHKMHRDLGHVTARHHLL